MTGRFFRRLWCTLRGHPYGVSFRYLMGEGGGAPYEMICKHCGKDTAP
jgi:hypothetical protein